MKKILIVVDMQNDFITGSLGCASAQTIVAAVSRKVSACKQQGYELLFTRDVHGPEYLSSQEGRNLPVIHCQAGESGCEIVAELAQYIDANSVVVDKAGFGSLELAQVLKQGNYELVEICGLVTNICVLFAAILAKTALSEAEIVIDESCVASFDDSLHNKSLDVLAGMQMTIIRKSQ